VAYDPAMRATSSPDASGAPGRARRLELLLTVIETLESEGSLDERIDGALRLARDAGLVTSGGVVRADSARSVGPPGDPATAEAALRLAAGVAREGAEGRERAGGSEILCVPLRAEGRIEGAVWFAAPTFPPDEAALARDVADRLARAVADERHRREQLELAGELRRSDALKTALLRGVTHELRTPLAGIANAADALMVIDDPRERAEILRAVIGETQRLERVVSNLLDLSRVEGGVLSARMEWCVLEELVGSGLLAAAAFLDGVGVSTDIPDDVPLVQADPVLTERILVNLLHNAARHGAPPVRVVGRRIGAELELAVEDAGPGVDPRVLPTVFEPFSHREGVGLGLGLPLCRRLAEAQGGRLEHRTAAGGGARFALVLPLTTPPEVEG
jgi:two-component system, OmpR family, sensor histidine kinase KdpD